jgi:hypothetical protein
MLDNGGVPATLQTIAETYVDDGYTVLGVASDKRPIGPWGITGDNRFDANNRDVLALGDATGVGIVAGPSGLFIIDLDSDAAVSTWVDRFGEITTRAAKTPRGMHLYYSAPPGKHKPQQGIMPGVDVRAGESYVVAPGSVTSGGSYSWANDLPIIELPADIFAVAYQAPARTEKPIAPHQSRRPKIDGGLSEAYDDIIAMNPTDQDLDDILRCPIDEIEVYAVKLIISERAATDSHVPLAI